MKWNELIYVSISIDDFTVKYTRWFTKKQLSRATLLNAKEKNEASQKIYKKRHYTLYLVSENVQGEIKGWDHKL